MISQILSIIILRVNAFRSCKSSNKRRLKPCEILAGRGGPNGSGRDGTGRETLAPYGRRALRWRMLGATLAQMLAYMHLGSGRRALCRRMLASSDGGSDIQDTDRWVAPRSSWQPAGLTTSFQASPRVFLSRRWFLPVFPSCKSCRRIPRKALCISVA